MRFVLAVSLSILILFPIPVGGASQTTSPSPDIDTTQGFLKICSAVDKDQRDSDEYLEIGYCVGWVAGLLDGVKVAEGAYNVVPANVLFCVPDGATTKQAVHIIRKYIADHPEDEHHSTRVIAVVAISKAFPCRQ